MKKKVFILFGPTASGKTAIIENLMDFSIEVISADSMQVYRGMDIGTAKPSLEERTVIPHHLIDIRNPDEKFNAGEFVRLAEEACLEADGRGALPLVSGGTGFYLSNLVFGLSEAPPSDENLREKLKHELAERGASFLMEELSSVDPISAGRIHIKDEYRLLRALEVYRLSGRPLSSFSSPWNAGQKDNSKDRIIERPFHFFIVGLKRKREELYRRINERTAAMFRAGLPEEVRRLFKAGYTPSDPALRAIGYREFFIEQTDKDANGLKTWRLSDDMKGVEALIAQNSRRYAKRQMTFFASLPDVKWIECDDEKESIRLIRTELERFIN